MKLNEIKNVIWTKILGQKYTPTSKEELKALVDDENIYLGDIDISNVPDLDGIFESTKRKDFCGLDTWYENGELKNKYKGIK